VQENTGRDAQARHLILCLLRAAGVASLERRRGIVKTQARSLFLRTLDRSLIAAALLMALILLGVQITHAG